MAKSSCLGMPERGPKGKMNPSRQPGGASRRPAVVVPRREAVRARLFELLPFALVEAVVGALQRGEVDADLLAQRVGRGADALDADHVEARLRHLAEAVEH